VWDWHEDARQLLVQGPDELIHVDIGVGRGRHDGEGRTFLSTTVLKRVKSGGLVTLTGPFSSADTKPWSCTVTRLARPWPWSAAMKLRTASAGTLLPLR